MNILGIETSCDETGLAIYHSQNGLLGHVLHSQVALHADYGGVVPELASRDHLRKLMPLLEALLADCALDKTDIDAIAYTAGPGLVGALMVGASFAAGLSLSLNIPRLAVHHMEGHLLAPMLEEKAPAFPFIAFLVSGGHTQLVRVNCLGSYERLGQSLDDAAGEAFDKTAKLLGLDYPGGPELARLASEGQPVFDFPRPMTDRPGLDFSFSGLKTFSANKIREFERQGCLDEQKSNLAASFETAVVETMKIKCRRALKQTGLSTLVVAGGVSANTRLRKGLQEMAEKESASVYYPRHEFCTDNAAMIAYAGCQRLLAGEHDDAAIKVRARWPMQELGTLNANSNG